MLRILPCILNHLLRVVTQATGAPPFGLPSGNHPPAHAPTASVTV